MKCYPSGLDYYRLLVSQTPFGVAAYAVEEADSMHV